MIGFSCAEPGLHSTQVALGTSTPGGGFQLFGQHLAEVINAIEPSPRNEAISTRGSLQNLALLEEGNIDIGLVEGNAVRQALDGIGRAPAKLAVLSVMYPNPGMFAVLADSPYRHIEDFSRASPSHSAHVPPDCVSWRTMCSTAVVADTGSARVE